MLIVILACSAGILPMTDDATRLLDTGLGDTGLGDTGLGDTGLGDTGLGDTGLGDTGLGDTDECETVDPIVLKMDATCADGWIVQWETAGWDPGEWAVVVKARTSTGLQTVGSVADQGCCGQLRVEGIGCDISVGWHIETWTAHGRTDCVEGGAITGTDPGCRVMELTPTCGGL